MTIFQKSILFKTNDCHYGVPIAAWGPEQLPPLLPLIQTWLTDSLVNL